MLFHSSLAPLSLFDFNMVSAGTLLRHKRWNTERHDIKRVIDHGPMDLYSSLSGRWSLIREGVRRRNGFGVMSLTWLKERFKAKTNTCKIFKRDSFAVKF